MVENASRERETTSAAAWLMRGRTDAVLHAVETLVPLKQVADEAPANEPGPAQRRNWSSTLDLIHEATTAIRISEERTTELENELQRTVAQAIEREQSLEGRLAQSLVRAELAEKRASEAEEWLARLHDAVVTGFTRATPEPTPPAVA